MLIGLGPTHRARPVELHVGLHWAVSRQARARSESETGRKIMAQSPSGLPI